MKTERKIEKFFTERDKILLKILFVLFLFFAVITNWNDISWIFNLKIVPAVIEQKIQNIIPEKKTEGEKIIKKENTVYCESNRIIISALDVDVPVVETMGTTEKEYREALDRGVVHFPDSVYPGEKGLTVLLGHSAPPQYLGVKYYWVFSKINELEEGDEIKVCYNNNLSVYTVVKKTEDDEIYAVGEEVPPIYSNGEKKEMVLMSCWPPGNNQNRIGVRAIVK
jgi:LPXTG-site transpeptidase (sortase) family protein